MPEREIRITFRKDDDSINPAVLLQLLADVPNYGVEIEESVPSPVERPLRALIDDVSKNSRRAAVTKSEQVLRTFLLAPNHRASIYELEPFFEGTLNPPHRVEICVAKLRRKLKKYRLRIRHLTAYELVLESDET